MLQRWTRPLTLLYVGGIVIWFGLWWFAGDAVWWLTLLNRAVPYLLLPMPFIILSAILNRQRILIGLSLIPLLIFALLYWPYLVPRTPPPHHSPNLRVMTYNVLYNNFDDEAVARIIMTHRPDLVGLQEVEPAMMIALTDRLGDLYPYSLMADDHEYGTTAVFSRYPIINSYLLDLQADRPAVVATVQVDNAEITFISAHLVAYGWRWWAELTKMPGITNQRTLEQNRQARILIKKIKQQTGTVIVACDCNTKETSGTYQILTGLLTNAARTTGWTVGAPVVPAAKQDRNLQHIDYILYQGALVPINVYRVKDSGGSDHLPVLALFAFDPPKKTKGIENTP